MFSAAPLARRVLAAPAKGLLGAAPKRHLSLHEYQSLGIFSDFGVQVPKFSVAKTPEEAASSAKNFGEEVVIKTQVLAGGRGLGHFKENNFQGGVHIIPSAKAAEFADKMLGKTLVTKQTGATGKPCDTVLLCEKFEISTEKYFAILMDRGSGGPIMIGSKTGGTSIEDIAAADPTAIVKMPVDIMDGLSEDQAKEMATMMGFEGPQASAAAVSISALYKVFIECDCKEALEASLSALEELAANPADAASAQLTVSTARLANGEPREALERAELALTAFKQAGDKPMQAAAMRTCANARIQLQEPADAVASAQDALAITLNDALVASEATAKADSASVAVQSSASKKKARKALAAEAKAQKHARSNAEDLRKQLLTSEQDLQDIEQRERRASEDLMRLSSALGSSPETQAPLSH